MELIKIHGFCLLATSGTNIHLCVQEIGFVARCMPDMTMLAMVDSMPLLHLGKRPGCVQDKVGRPTLGKINTRCDNTSRAACSCCAEPLSTLLSTWEPLQGWVHTGRACPAAVFETYKLKRDTNAAAGTGTRAANVCTVTGVPT
ncbi:hypothetical protein IAQ61_005819 [Plenodomus lingam]|uniref:uncharacterized protein n=1 Tax=Leptosphaeria maculans TaxID=5022 RepID=UPI00331BECC9|nr:hypothetical protein IAQ61_005819 [Plenodomus lingam]